MPRVPEPDPVMTPPVAETSAERPVLKPTGPVVLTLSRLLPGCKRTRMLAIEGASGVKLEPLHEVDSIQRALTQIRGIHPPPIMVIDGQSYPSGTTPSRLNGGLVCSSAILRNSK